MAEHAVMLPLRTLRKLSYQQTSRWLDKQFLSRLFVSSLGGAPNTAVRSVAAAYGKGSVSPVEARERHKRQ